MHNIKASTHHILQARNIFFQYICSLVGTGGRSVQITSHIHLVMEFKMPTEQL